MKTLTALFRKLWDDEDGFIVSAEMVLVATIGVLSMVVGLSTVSRSINNELYDMADAFDAVNQDYDDGDRYGDRGRRGNRYAAKDQDDSDIVAR